MPQTESIDFDLDAPVAHQRERNLGVLVPIPVSERLETLTDILYSEGHGRVPRKELVAALLLAAPTDPDELATCLRKYRTSRVRDTLVAEPLSDNIVSFPLRSPGPRARSA
jgi:hypothetical protein